MLDVFSNTLLAVSLGQALGGMAAVIAAIGLVAVFGGLIGAAVAALSERGLAGVKASLVIAGIGGLAWVIAGAFWVAGGLVNNIQMGQIN